MSGCSAELALASRKTSAVLSSRSEANPASECWEDMHSLAEECQPPTITLLDVMLSRLKHEGAVAASGLGEHRCAVLDWMVGVLALHRQRPSAFFRAAQLLDRFHASAVPTHREAKLSACAAVSIASKFDESRFVSLKSLEHSSVRYRLRRDEIIARQFEFVKAFGLDCPRYTCAEAVEEVAAELPLDERRREFVVRAALLVLRMCVFDAERWGSADRVELVGCSVVFGLRLLAGLDAQTRVGEAVECVARLLKVEPAQLGEKLRDVHAFVVGFEGSFSGAKNLRRHHKFSALP